MIGEYDHSNGTSTGNVTLQNPCETCGFNLTYKDLQRQLASAIAKIEALEDENSRLKTRIKELMSCE